MGFLGGFLRHGAAQNGDKKGRRGAKITRNYLFLADFFSSSCLSFAIRSLKYLSADSIVALLSSNKS